MPKSPFPYTYQALPDSIKNLVNRIIQEINPDEIILFGSRARGDHRENSDFDIAVRASLIPPAVWAKLRLAIEEEPITLYQVDLVDFNQLNDDYKKRISSEGKYLA
jgi:predicted nucleotidyltransferase